MSISFAKFIIFLMDFEPSSSDDFIVNNVAAGSAFSILQATGIDGRTPILYATFGRGRELG